MHHGRPFAQRIKWQAMRTSYGCPPFTVFRDSALSLKAMRQPGNLCLEAGFMGHTRDARALDRIPATLSAYFGALL